LSRQRSRHPHHSSRSGRTGSGSSCRSSCRFEQGRPQHMHGARCAVCPSRHAVLRHDHRLAHEETRFNSSLHTCVCCATPRPLRYSVTRTAAPAAVAPRTQLANSHTCSKPAPLQRLVPTTTPPGKHQEHTTALSGCAQPEVCPHPPRTKASCYTRRALLRDAAARPAAARCTCQPSEAACSALVTGALQSRAVGRQRWRGSSARQLTGTTALSSSSLEGQGHAVGGELGAQTVHKQSSRQARHASSSSHAVVSRRRVEAPARRGCVRATESTRRAPSDQQPHRTATQHVSHNHSRWRPRGWPGGRPAPAAASCPWLRAARQSRGRPAWPDGRS
jgi:hypothetical protein